MKILFVNPTLGGDYSALDIAITLLGTIVNRTKLHTAKICDLTFHRKNWKKHIDSYFDNFRPDVVGISCSTLYMKHVVRIAKYIKTKYKVRITLGGYHVSTNPEESIHLSFADVIFLGDAENSIIELLDAYEKNSSLCDIKNIWFKENSTIHRNGRGKFTENIDLFPRLDWELWADLDKYLYFLGMLYFLGTRGCPYKCIYCDAHEIAESVEGNYYRMRDPADYANEIIEVWKRYHRKGLRLAQLFDQVPTMNKDWLFKFCKTIIDSGIKIKFSIFSRIDNLDEDKIQILSKAGCKILRMGIEAGNDYIRNNVYKKNISKKKIIKISRLCKKYRIGITAFYMIGGPGESKNTVEETITLARKVDANRSAFFMFKPVTKESLKAIQECGGRVNNRRYDASDNFTYGAVLELKDLRARDAEFLQKKAYALTLYKRIIRIIMKNHVLYPIRMVKYLMLGTYYGLDYSYLFPYYHIYGYNHVWM